MPHHLQNHPCGNIKRHANIIEGQLRRFARQSAELEATADERGSRWARIKTIRSPLAHGNKVNFWLAYAEWRRGGTLVPSVCEVE
jgi:hypothetical protein